ncbi:carbohydrate kinase family protein [Nocardioides panaciterrulae]|uniref:Sugar/nucleoside kinase (Ribokinase family) n=1 Tax=Nocardioides panaciterrulae TaxID=661492 RepID=A0A7Y9JAX5_9ACTN|nr:PfkB family carbohydrate kinase [Nocardioides panaciterrulae]NYD41813.1 sugar/nucleoside kinase (ribokinase family) [Nocardioides panaciterrulae]
MVDVVVCGPASWNHVVDVDELPAPTPHMQLARGDRQTLGGTSAGKALHLHELGRAARLYTVVGTDETATAILGRLRRAGVVVAAEASEGPSERHLNLMDPHGGRVSIYLDVPRPPTGPGPDRSLPAGMEHDLAAARAVVLDLSERSRGLAGSLAATGLPIWTDVHDYDGEAAFHRPFLAAASHVFMNADRLPDALEFLRAVVRGGADLAVCTLGAAGAVAVDRDMVVHRVPAVPVDRVVDTNGAGDGFLAGVLHASLDGAPVTAALRAGAAQAARALGSRHLSPLLDD